MAQMCVGGLSGNIGRLKMLQPVSHKVNKTARANEANTALLFCDPYSLIARKGRTCFGETFDRCTHHSAA